MDLKKGLKFKCNINKKLMEVIGIEKNKVFIKDLKNGKIFKYPVESFKRCNITIFN